VRELGERLLISLAAIVFFTFLAYVFFTIGWTILQWWFRN